MIRAVTLLLPCALLGVACLQLQPLNNDAASGSADGTTSEPTKKACTANEIAVSGGQCLPYDPNTPPIELGGGRTTDDPCRRTLERSLEIRQVYCGDCHGGGPGQNLGGFHTILDDTQLVTAVSSSAKDDAGAPQRMLVPGDPDSSRVYQLVIALGKPSQMPPIAPPTIKPNPMPTIADLSVLRSWVLCLGNKGAYGEDRGASLRRDGGTTSPGDAGVSRDGASD